MPISSPSQAEGEEVLAPGATTDPVAGPGGRLDRHLTRRHWPLALVLVLLGGFVAAQLAGEDLLDGQLPPGSASRAVQQQVFAAGQMPNLVGWRLEQIGGDDRNAILYQLHDVIGAQRTRYIADDSPPGTVISQSPPARSPLDDIPSWSLAVSAGGPSVAFEELPVDVRDIATSLEGYDRHERSVVIDTPHGSVYKTDAWVVASTCDAVDEMYRSTTDLDYRTVCPDRVP